MKKENWKREEIFGIFPKQEIKVAEDEGVRGVEKKNM